MGIQNDYGDYLNKLISRFWEYRDKHFGGRDDLFDTRYSDRSGPCVFTDAAADHNVLTRPGASEGEVRAVVSAIPSEDRHRWFRSMSSSQAVAQSVFGNLVYCGKLELLENLLDCDGSPLFGKGIRKCTLEVPVGYLGEPRCTSLDAFLEGDRRVAIECKLAEEKIGPCSRPGLKTDHSRHCNGDYEVQRERSHRCSLTEFGVQYWTHIPKLFNHDWSADQDHMPCPLRDTYQLVRNILAACVDPEEPHEVAPESGHCVLLYDANNPMFWEGGKAMKAWQDTKDGLKYPALLQKCSWQELMPCIRKDPDLKWLSDALGEKYGLA